MTASPSQATPKAQKMAADGLRVSPLIDHGVNEHKDYDFHALRIASSCFTRSQSS